MYGSLSSSELESWKNLFKILAINVVVAGFLFFEIWWKTEFFFLCIIFEYNIALSLEFTANTDDLKKTCTTMFPGK